MDLWISDLAAVAVRSVAVWEVGGWIVDGRAVGRPAVMPTTRRLSK
jgi:hypothetical protein